MRARRRKGCGIPVDAPDVPAAAVGGAPQRPCQLVTAPAASHCHASAGMPEAGGGALSPQPLAAALAAPEARWRTVAGFWRPATRSEKVQSAHLYSSVRSRIGEYL